jgi:invasion protein IalB
MAGSWPFLALVVLAGLAPLGEGLRADELETWNFQCMEDEDSGEQICTTEIATSDDGADFLVYFVHHRGGKSPLVVTGDEQRFSGLTIKVDKKDPVQADKCDVGMCYFELEKSRLLLRQFRKGRSARLTIVDDRLEFILDKEITLRGFSAAYATF